MKILTAQQIKEVDEFTIQNEPIKSIDLMERAALACVGKLVKLIDSEEKVFVFCGKGNNGGDGMAIARLLIVRGFDVQVFVIHHKDEFSSDAKINYDLLKSKNGSIVSDINSFDEIKVQFNPKEGVIIDALLGTGISKAASGLLADVIDYLNKSHIKIISIDVPSGLYIDETSIGNTKIINSSLTLCLQLPKLAFLLPENKNFVPKFELVNISLSEQGINESGTTYYFLTKKEITPLLKPRNKFDHKGTYGHAILFAGSKGKSGAAVISAKACLRSGAGMLTVHSTQNVLQNIVNHLPEAMGIEDENKNFISGIEKTENYDAVGFGPGIGTHEETAQALKKLLNYFQGPLIIDADGLNILSENKTWLSFLPPATILTPHPKEFERLAGKSDDDFERLKTLKQFSIKNNCIVILKGAHSVIAMPDGNMFFNSTGNPGLAKAGSGDGLTGIILGLLTRGYSAPRAALIGTFIHGYAADLCLKKMSMESVLISDIIKMLPKAFMKLES